MTHAPVPDFSVPMPARAAAVVIEESCLAAPIGRFPGSAAVVTVSTEDAPLQAEHGPGIAGDALAALLLIIGGAVVIGWATLL